MRAIKFTFGLAFKGFKLLVLAALLCVVTIFVPRVYDRAVRDQVASQVFKIIHRVDDTENFSVGTGFVVHDKNGKTLILSNRHVCERAKGGVVTLQQDGYETSAKVIRMADDSDLCALTAPKGFKGLSMSDEFESGQRVWAVGHPRGLPHTRTEGEIVGIGTEENREKITSVEEMRACRSRNYSTVVELDMVAAAQRRGTTLPPGMPAVIYLCVSKIRVIYTTIPVSGGNSGSPMVDQDGFVKGIIMAMHSADGVYGWALAVSLPEVADFLKVAFKEVK